MREPPEWILVGRVRRAHGTAGELLVETLTDFTGRFKAGAELLLARKGSGEKRPVRIAASRGANEGLIVRVEGVDDRDNAKGLTAAEFFVDGSDLLPATPDSYYPFQVEGSRVYEGGELIGSVTRLVESRVANPYLEVRREDGTQVLIPFVKDVVSVIDVDGGRIEIRSGFIG